MENEQISPSCEKYVEVFDYFLDQTLQPVSPENLQKAIPQIADRSLLARFSKIFAANVKENSKQEFSDINEECDVFRKLAKLDEIKQQDTMAVNMKNFTFTRANPDDLRSRVEYDAKKNFLQRLNQNISAIQQKISNLEPRLKNANSRINENTVLIERTTNRIKEVIGE